MGLMFGLILASFFPLLFLGIIRKADFYQIGQYHLILISLSGGILAYLFASLTNITLRISTLVDPGLIMHFIAPVLEEIMKGLVLLTLVRLSKLTFSVDGALYGFATGVGFAILENYEYIFEDPAIAMGIALQRIFSANLVHASSSALVGMALAMFHLRKTRSRWLVSALVLILAISQHIFFNIMIENAPSLFIAIMTGLVGAVFVYIAMQFGKKQAQNWIKEKLGMGDRVTRSEVAAVNRLPDIDELLRPVSERFGVETASQVEKLLYLQARLGIKQKTLESFQKDAKLQKVVEAELREMRDEMDEARRAIGLYAMLFVRGLYTEEMVSVWDQMQSRIREHSALHGACKGTGLWSSIEERLNAPNHIERPD